MALNFSGGQFCSALWTPTGFAQAILGIKSHSLDLTVQLFDVSSSLTPGGRARMAGLPDCAGNLVTVYDLDEPFYAPFIQMQPGVRGICAFGLSLIKYLQVPVICERLRYASSMEQAVEQSADVKMDVRSGFVVYPPL